MPDRIGSKSESLSCACVLIAVVRPSIFFQGDTDTPGAFCLSLHDALPISVWADGRLCREQTVVVVDHLECQCLHRLVGGPRADRGGPPGYSLRAEVGRAGV